MGYYCRVCFHFYSNEDTAKKVHCSSQAHYEKLKVISYGLHILLHHEPVLKTEIYKCRLYSFKFNLFFLISRNTWKRRRPKHSVIMRQTEYGGVQLVLRSIWLCMKLSLLSLSFWRIDFSVIFRLILSLTHLLFFLHVYQKSRLFSIERSPFMAVCLL